MTHTTPIIIDLTRPMEEAFWCFVLDVEPARLRAAITAVGPNLHRVDAHLRGIADCARRREFWRQMGSPFT